MSLTRGPLSSSQMAKAEISTLENGLTVLTVPGGTGSMSAMLFVGAGSRYETREVSGTAHFLEHLFFKGTPRRPTTLEIATEIDSLGCRFNAFTSEEYTAYFVKGAADYTEQAVDVIADMLQRPDPPGGGGARARRRARRNEDVRGQPAVEGAGAARPRDVR